MKIRSYRNRIGHEPAPNDPVYQNALLEKEGRVAASAPAPHVDPGLRQAAAQQLQPPEGAVPAGPEAPVPAVPPPLPPAPQGELPRVQPPPPAPFAPVPPAPQGALPPNVQPPPPAPQPQPALPPVPVVPAPPRPAGPDDGAEVPPPPRPEPPPLPPEDPGPQITIRPRTALGIQVRNFQQPNGENAVVITSGVIITVVDLKGVLDVEADRAVVWTRGDLQQLFKPDQPEANGGIKGQRTWEFYLAGNVELRQESRGG